MNVEESQKQSYAQVHARLMGRPERLKRPIIAIPEAEIAEPVLPPPPKYSHRRKQIIPQRDEINIKEDGLWRDGVKVILLAFGENLARLRSYQRDSHIVACRKMIAEYLRQRGWSYPRIGNFLNRDHSSILSLISPDYKRGEARRQRKIALDMADNRVYISLVDGQ